MTQWKVVIGGTQAARKRYKSGHVYECKRDAVRRAERVASKHDVDVDVVYLIRVEQGNVQRLEKKFGETDKVYAYEHRFTRIRR